jgi:predicted nucleic acid-binding Zn ribbon protein
MSDAKRRRPRRSTSKPPAAAGGPQSLGSALSQLFALKGYANEKGNAQLAECWKQIAGDRISERTRVLGVHRGVLQIGVSSAAMMGELASFHKLRLIEQLQTHYPDLKLKGIKFRLRGDLKQPVETLPNERRA